MPAGVSFRPAFFIHSFLLSRPQTFHKHRVFIKRPATGSVTRNTFTPMGFVNIFIPLNRPDYRTCSNLIYSNDETIIFLTDCGCRYCYPTAMGVHGNYPHGKRRFQNRSPYHRMGRQRLEQPICDCSPRIRTTLLCTGRATNRHEIYSQIWLCGIGRRAKRVCSRRTERSRIVGRALLLSQLRTIRSL